MEKSGRNSLLLKICVFGPNTFIFPEVEMLKILEFYKSRRKIKSSCKSHPPQESAVIMVDGQQVNILLNSKANLPNPKPGMFFKNLCQVLYIEKYATCFIICYYNSLS